MKRMNETAVIAAVMAISLAVSALFSAADAKSHVQESVIRLHILADSDDEEDQALKLKVRDGILARSEELFDPYSTAEQAAAQLEEKMDDIKAAADEILIENGSECRTTCELEVIPFDERNYGSFIVPEGNYTALRIKIGSGEGHNWWCVMYPPLCVPCAELTDEEIMEKYGGELTDDDIRLLTEKEDFTVRLYIVELIKKLLRK